jgi:hypothetical protein
MNQIGGEATAVRLLGSAQGLLVATGLLTVGTVWQDNRTWLKPESSRAFDAAMDELSEIARSKES